MDVVSRFEGDTCGQASERRIIQVGSLVNDFKLTRR